jgi:hypothetical protein
VKKLQLSAVFIGLAFIGELAAQDMARTDFDAGLNAISLNYKRAKKACSLQREKGNAQHLCKLEAKVVAKRGRADLRVRFDPSFQHRVEAAVVRAETNFDLAQEKCAYPTGVAVVNCVDDARAVQGSAVAEAVLRLNADDARASGHFQLVKASNSVTAARAR